MLRHGHIVKDISIIAQSSKGAILPRKKCQLGRYSVIFNCILNKTLKNVHLPQKLTGEE